MTAKKHSQMSYLILMTTVIGMLPSQTLRRFLYEYAALVCFRILSRSFSAVVQFHNLAFKPKKDGICVANHTTPIDVVILQCNRSYALVRISKSWQRKEKILKKAG